MNAQDWAEKRANEVVRKSRSMDQLADNVAADLREAREEARGVSTQIVVFHCAVAAIITFVFWRLTR